MGLYIALSDYWTVGHSTVQPFDNKTDFAYSPNPNCPTDGKLSQGSTGSVFYSLGRKWEGNNQFFWCGKEMGRKKSNYVSMGKKWEGYNEIGWHGREMGRKL